MNPIRIPNKYKFTKRDWYLNEIKNSKFPFKIDKRDIFNILKNISENNSINDAEHTSLNFLYFIFRLFQSNDVIPDLFYEEGGKPKNGYELKNPKTLELLGVYHIHLATVDESIIIWYPTFDNKNGTLLKFLYLKHPSDNYKNILTQIYNSNNDGFHLEKRTHFIYLKNLLNFNINESLRIRKFGEF